ncbi:MAG: glycosyltransferase family 4 protein [Candidatus Binatia bacterium]
MKVLVFTSLYPNNMWPNQGVFIKERVAHVAKLDHCEVKVVAPVPYFPPVRLGARWRFSQVVQHEIREGIEIIHPRYYMIPKVGMVFYGVSLFASLLPHVRRMQHSFAFDLIDAHFVYPDGMAAVLLGRMLGKPVVVSARGSDINVYKDLTLIRPLLRWTLGRANAVVTVSQALKDAMERLGTAREKIHVIPNGVDSEKFFPMARAKAREQVGIRTERVILSVGHLTANKGFALLVRALKVLVDEYGLTDLRLVIVGEGGYRKELEQLIHVENVESRVTLVGAIAHSELHSWYSAADVFCLASAHEGCPNVVLESLACGTPVVATAVGGIPEILRSSDIGILTERKERALAASLAEALQTIWQKEVIIRYARQQTWAQVAKEVFHVFNKAIDCRTPGFSIGVGETKTQIRC